MIIPVGGRPPIRLSPLLILGFGVAIVLVTLNFATLGAVAWRAEAPGTLRSAEWAAVRFTLWQALASAGLSVLLALPLARALARRTFFGRGLLITLMGAPFILPTLVAVLGLIAVFGRGGLLNQALVGLGLPPMSIYGPHGVVLAHVFYNLPLATRLILQGWLSIPVERFRLAASLGFSAADVQRRLEWPMLRDVVPGAFLVIFLICLTSFAVALTLGGGPRATTVELAIYQAFRFDFDLGRAALLAVLQFAICGVGSALTLWVAVPSALGGGLDRSVERWDAVSGWLRGQDALVLTLAAVFLLAPLAMVVASGVPGFAALPESVWRAALRSMAVALVSTGLCLTFALALAHCALRVGLVFDGVGMLALAASPLVVGTGLFILIFPLVDPAAVALPITALVNAAMALPFALRAILPALRQLEATQGRLADSLGMTGWPRLRYLTLPRLRRPLGFAGGLAAALSMGDLGVIVLFAGSEGATLPLQVYRLMAAYRMDDAAAAALLLLALSLLLFWIFDRGGARRWRDLMACAWTA